jgi:CheY-like chemotaxis protein
MPTEDTWAVMFVDDDAEMCQLVAKGLDGQAVMDTPDWKLKVDTEIDFDRALDKLETSRYDLIILDVRLGPLEEERQEEAGIIALEQIKSRRFVPVIFYTALPMKVIHLVAPLVGVVEKTEGISKLSAAIREIFSTKLPFVNRALLRRVEEVQRDYMWDFVSPNWGKFGDTADRTALAYLLARRLAKSLDGPGIQRLAAELGDTSGAWCSEDKVHPMMYYIIPPMSPQPMSGDIVREQTDDQARYMVLLTPSCDIDKGKAEWMLFARCLLLKEEQECTEFAKNPQDGKKKGDLVSFLRDNRQGKQPERFKCLPGVMDFPDLIVDFQQLTAISLTEFSSLKELGRLERIASLDSPYAESLTARFTRYYSRLGVPDLNIDLIVDKLTSAG